MSPRLVPDEETFSKFAHRIDTIRDNGRAGFSLRLDILADIECDDFTLLEATYKTATVDEASAMRLSELQKHDADVFNTVLRGADEAEISYFLDFDDNEESQVSVGG